MKKITLIGNVGADAEQVNNDGDSFVTFSLAVTSGTGDKKITEWFEVNCNGLYAEIAMEHVKKGSKVYVEGKPSFKAYKTKTTGDLKVSLKVNAKEMRLLNFVGGEDVEGEANNG